MKKLTSFLLALGFIQLCGAQSFIEQTEPIEEKFLKKTKPLNADIIYSVDCGFFKEQERLCIFYGSDQIGPAGYLFRVKPTRELMYLCEYYALASYLCRDACENPWPLFKNYKSGKLDRKGFVSQYRSYAKCVSRALSTYEGMKLPEGVDETSKKYHGHLLNLKFFCLCFLKYIKNKDYDWLYGKLKERFAKYDAKDFDKILGVLKDTGKPEAQRLYTFYPKFYDVYMNWLVSRGDDEMFELLERKGVEFWD